MFSKYKEFMSKYISLNFIEWNFFEKKLSILRYKKGEIIHHVGDICNKLLFINSGLARSYILDPDGKDYTWTIYFNDKNSTMINLFVVDYDSFVNQNESRLSIEVIEDCELVAIDYQDIIYQYNKQKKSERFGRLMNQEAYAYLHNLIIDRQTKSAKERFDEFVINTPHLLDKVPQYHIATFLGITPQHLSRLKNKID